MLRKVISQAMVAFALCSLLLATCAFAQEAPPFNASSLVRLGDSVKYGSYVIYMIGDGIYKINDPGTLEAIKGGRGVDMYMVCGTQKALLIDVGNNYISGYEPDLIKPRKNSAEELRAVVYGLAGKQQLEIAATHINPDHEGMSGAFLNRNVTLWTGEGEDLTRLKKEHNLDPSIYTVFTQGKKTFDLGGGRIVDTLLVRGHSNGGTVYILKKDGIFFTGDALGFASGANFASVDRLKNFTEDIQKLADYILANFSLYERAALKLYTGHSSLDVRGGYSGSNMENVDGAYLDWRYIQNLRSCANAIAKGAWLVEGSPLRLIKRQPDPKSPPVATMVYGIASITMPFEAAYQAAGLPVPK